MGISHLEDPVTWPLVESMAFYGGAFLVMPGLTEHLRPGLDLLLKAALLHPDMDDQRAFHRSISVPGQAILQLSDAVCKRAGLVRSQAPGSARHLEIPTGDRLDRFIHAVTWTDQEIADLFAGTNVPPEALKPFESSLGIGSPNGVSPSNWPLINQPLVRSGNRIVVGMPHAMLTALARYVLACAHSHSCLDRLTKSFHESTVMATDRCLDSMGLPKLEQSLQPASARPLMTEQLRLLDSDKLLHVIVLSDDLSTFEPDDPAGLASYPDGSELDTAFAAALTSRAAMNSPVKEILGLVVLSGVARSAHLGLSGGSPQQEVLPFNIQELVTISYLEPSNPLYLWHFSNARKRLREKARVQAMSITDELFFYRSKDSSFYLTDDGPYDFIALQPNEGGALLLEAHQKYDPHAIRTTSGGFQECIRVHAGSRLPLYCPRLPKFRLPTQCIELPEGEIWVSTDLSNVNLKGVGHDVAITLVDALAFWIARCGTMPFVRSAAAHHLRVEVAIERSDEWKSPDSNPDDSSRDTPPRVDQVTERLIRVHFHPDTLVAFGRTDPPADRFLFEPFFHMLAVQSGQRAGDADAALQVVMPTPFHRRLIAFSAENTAAAYPRSLPPKHLVPAAAEYEALDSVHTTFDAAGIDEGEVPSDKREYTINAVVEGFYKQLTHQLSGLMPQGLLEWLIAHNEAVVDAHSLARLLEPYTLSCFAEDAGSAKEFVGRLARFAKADQCCRFLIELVAATPPTGVAKMSYGTYDRLLGLSAQIIALGMTSDDIRYGSDDPRIARLPSGRLGISKSIRQSTRDRFMESHGVGERARLFRAVIAQDSENMQAKRKRAHKAILDASSAEFGFTLDQHADLISIAVEECVRQQRAVAVTDRAKFVALVSQELKVAESQASDWIRSLSLSARPGFFKVPAPATQADVYPWKYNRLWSLMRRPFVVRGDDLLFASSQLVRARTYLRGLCFSGRLKAQSPEMTQALGRMTEIAGYRFNATIAEMFRRVPGLVVLERAQTFGQLRIASESGHELGDIDVLVIDPRRRRVRAYECKDLSLARVPSEIANELAELAKGDRSIVSKHGKRVAWLRKHLDLVLDHESLPNRGKWNVEGVIIVDEELISRFLVRLPMKVVTIAELEKLLASGAQIP